jgi:hypothetical protein
LQLLWQVLWLRSSPSSVSGTIKESVITGKTVFAVVIVMNKKKKSSKTEGKTDYAAFDWNQETCSLLRKTY